MCGFDFVDYKVKGNERLKINARNIITTRIK